MADAWLRNIVLLRNIPREPQKISTTELWNRLNDANYSVSIRTIQRDLEKLSSEFPLVRSEAQGRGNEGIGWSFLKDGKSLTFPILGGSAALSLSFGFQYLSQLIPDSALENLAPLRAEAEEVLNQYDSGKYKKWMQKVRAVPENFLLPPQFSQDVVNSVYQALLESKQFKATYKGKPDQIIHPYGLIQQGHTLYLICGFFDYDGVRMTALHRYSEIEILDEYIKPNPKFDIDSYLSDGSMLWSVNDNKTHQVKLRVHKELVSILQETPISSNQILNADKNNKGWSFLTTPAIDSQQLRRWILSQGNKIEVIEPLALKDSIKLELQNTLQNYID
tara:strand:- start:35440 stop:36441 length:1002 start_codon:yes stop_codon:yes gene_type:complete